MIHPVSKSTAMSIATALRISTTVPLYQDLRRWQLTTKPDAWCPVLQADCAGRISRATPRDGLTGRVVRKLQLEPTSYCNLKCPACPVTHFHTDPGFRDDRANILPLEVMLSVVEQLPDLELILFYDYGESFLHKDAIPFLQTVRRQRPEILLHTSTNGLALNPEKIEALAAEPLIDLIVFSIDGAWQESYRRYRVNGNLSESPGEYGGAWCVPVSAPVRPIGCRSSGNTFCLNGTIAMMNWPRPVGGQPRSAYLSSGCLPIPRGLPSATPRKRGDRAAVRGRDRRQALWGRGCLQRVECRDARGATAAP